MSEPKSYVTTRDIVIPAGTRLQDGPNLSRYYTPHVEVVVGINKDLAAHFRVDLEEALRDGIVRERQ